MQPVSVAASLLIGDKLIFCQTNEPRKAHSLINFSAFRLSESLASLPNITILSPRVIITDFCCSYISFFSNSLLVNIAIILFPIFSICNAGASLNSVNDYIYYVFGYRGNSHPAIFC